MVVLLTGLAAGAMVMLHAFGVDSEDVNLFELGIGLFFVAATLAFQTYRRIP